MRLRGEEEGEGRGSGGGSGGGNGYGERRRCSEWAEMGGYGGRAAGDGGGALRHSHTATISPPVRYSHYSHSASGVALKEAEIRSPPHLPLPFATRPSSYAASETPSPLPPLPPSSLDSLISTLQNPLEDEDLENSVLHLRHFSRSSAQNRLALCRPDLLHALLPLLQSPYPSLQINSAAALVNLSLEKENKSSIVRAGALRCLVDLLKNGVPDAQEHAAGAIFSLSLVDEHKHSIGVLGAIPPLIQILRSGPAGARPDAAMALYHLSHLQSNRAKLVKEGAIPILLNFAQAEDKPELASRSLLTLSNVAALPDGRAKLLELDAVSKLVKLLAPRSSPNNRNEADIPEQAAAVLLLLSNGNLRFKSLAMRAGAGELLRELVDAGTPRAREKALALLAIMKESPSDPDDSDTNSILPRQYLRRTLARTDGYQMNSSGF